MTKTSPSDDKNRATASGNGAVLCSCVELTHGQFREYLGGNAELSFDDVLRATGAGRTCTACLLDLEYAFSEARHSLPASKRKSVVPAPVAQGWLKQGIYRVLDGISPLVSTRTESWSPILYGKNIEQWLSIANQRFLYRDGADGPSPHCADVTVRDANGSVRLSEHHEIPVDGTLRINLSEPFSKGLSADQPDLEVGSLQIVQSWRRPGLRGTTRAQIEVLTPNSTCAVHTQAPGPKALHRFSALCRPSEERLFYTVVNPSKRPVRLRAECRIDGDEVNWASDAAVPAQGAILAEIKPTLAPEESERPIDLRWRIDGPNKLHILCASPQLERFSIDHL